MLDTTTGRWMEPDPKAFAGGDPDLYRYAINDPMDLVDPSGLDGGPRAVADSPNGPDFVAPGRLPQAAPSQPQWLSPLDQNARWDLGSAYISTQWQNFTNWADGLTNWMEPAPDALSRPRPPLPASDAAFVAAPPPQPFSPWTPITDENRAAFNAWYYQSLTAPAELPWYSQGSDSWWRCAVNGPDGYYWQFLCAFGSPGSAGYESGPAEPRPVEPAEPGFLGSCFPAGTPVGMLDGQRPIEAVKRDDRLWAFDPVSGDWRPCRVIKTLCREYEGRWVYVTAAGETIETTPCHPFWVVRGEELASRPRPSYLATPPDLATAPGRWVAAGDLRVGDLLLLRGARTALVECLRSGPFRGLVYNFLVAELQCYSVGEAGFLVHNGNNPDQHGGPAPIAGRGPVHIDIGGEGRYPDAINVNPGMGGRPPVTSGPTQVGGAGAAGRPIPNLIQAPGERLPFEDQSVDIVTLQNAPIRPRTVSEIARVIRPGGDIRLVGPNTPESLAAHQRVADAVGGSVFQTVVGDCVFTNIIVPAR